MKIWYLEIEHIPVWPGKAEPDGPSCVWFHGKEGKSTGLLTEAWLRENGFKTEAAAKRSVRKACIKENSYWDAKLTAVRSMEVPDHKFRYKIYHPYEIVILDEEGNELEYNYEYGSRKDAEKAAERYIYLKEAEAERGKDN